MKTLCSKAPSRISTRFRRARTASACSPIGRTIASIRSGSSNVQATATSWFKRETSTAQRPRRGTFIPFERFRPKTAPRNWDCRGRGTNACHTFAWNSRRAAVRNCSRNISSRVCTQATHFAQSWVSGNMLPPLLLVSEVRTIAADSLWLSPCYGTDSVAIHFTWKQRWSEVRNVLPLVEGALEPFRARPHWGKLFAMDRAALEQKYARLSDFRALIDEFDPRGKFSNRFLESRLLTRRDAS